MVNGLLIALSFGDLFAGKDPDDRRSHVGEMVDPLPEVLHVRKVFRGAGFVGKVVAHCSSRDVEAVEMSMAFDLIGVVFGQRVLKEVAGDLGRIEVEFCTVIKEAEHIEFALSFLAPPPFHVRLHGVGRHTQTGKARRPSLERFDGEKCGGRGGEGSSLKEVSTIHDRAM